MKNVFAMIVAFSLIGCVVQEGVVFEKLSFQQTLGKARNLNKSILVDMFSDG
jgi:uncharacterized membrane protein